MTSPFRSRPDTEEIIVSEDPKKALKYVRNSVYGRYILEEVLDKYADDLDSSLRSSQFVIVERVGEKAAKYGGVKKVRLLKPFEKMHYRLAEESRSAEFFIEVDKKTFDGMDLDLQLRKFFDQLSLIYLDIENNKYGLDRLVGVNLKSARKFGLKVPEVRAVVNNANAAPPPDVDQDAYSEEDEDDDA